MSEHTPTPWVAEKNAYGTWFIYRAEVTETAPTGLKYRQLVCGGDGYRTLTEANAAFIVTAVNHHEAFLKVVAAAQRVCWFDWSGNDPDAVAAMDALRDAAINGLVEGSPK